jgi:hypothetical protein
MDISDTLAPNSDQLDAVDLLGGPMTFTITKVDVKQDAEQPVTIHLAEFPRPWRPGKSMRRVLASCWGGKGSVYVGRRVTLYCDESVRFGNDVVGGTRISHLSHIDKPKSIPLLVSRGKSATFKVQPLPDPTPAEQVASLRAEWKNADPERRKVIEAAVASLTQPEDSPTDPEELHDLAMAVEPEIFDPTLADDWGQQA